MLQVNPVLFDIDFVRANEDPAAVEAANSQAQELEGFLLDDGLLDAALEQTLPGSTVTNQDINVNMADPYYQADAGIPDEEDPVMPGTTTEGDCIDVPTPDEYTCEQQRGWGKCTADFIIAGDYCASTCGRC